jgi:peptide/nickel transport system substrate-binding protein
MKGHKLIDGATGKQVAFALEFPSSYSDWMTDCSLLESEMTAIGIDLTCDGISYETWVANTDTSTYQASFDPATGPQSYQELDQVFAVGAKGLPAVGQSNDSTNIERFDDPQAVSALAALASTEPSDTAALQKQYDVLEKIMATQVPVIPLFTSTYHADFVDGPLYGWPSTSNSYLCVACDGAQEQLLLDVHKTK